MDVIQMIPVLMIFLVMLVLLYVFAQRKEVSNGKNTMDQSPQALPQPSQNIMEVEALKLLLPLRIQASERLVLLLERLQPRMIIARHIASQPTALGLAQSMLMNVREEFEHNLSQQLFVSDTAWQMVKTAREEVIQLIHLSLSNVGNEASAELLAKELLTLEAPEMIDHAVRRLRDELNSFQLKS